MRRVHGSSLLRRFAVLSIVMQMRYPSYVSTFVDASMRLQAAQCAFFAQAALALFALSLWALYSSRHCRSVLQQRDMSSC